MRISRFCFCVAVLCLCPLVSADVFDNPVTANKAALQSLSDKLASQTHIKGHFVQKKFLSILDKPLRSEGSFALSGQNNFVWQIEQPFAVSYRFSKGDLYRQDSRGKAQVKPADAPMLYGFFVFFNTLFDLSQTELDKAFHLYFQQQNQQWVLGLRPKEARLKNAIDTIVVEGEALSPKKSQGMAVAITKVTIHEPGGDYSQLLFSY